MFATPCCWNAVAMSSTEHESFILYWWWTLWKQKRKRKIYTSRIVCHCSSKQHIKKKSEICKAPIGFGICLLLCQYVSLSVLWVVTCDRPCPLEILSEVADQRGLLCSVFSDGPLDLYTANSVCVNVRVCQRLQVYTDVYLYVCVCVCAGTDCLHLCKYTLTCSCACNGQ